MVRKKLVHAVRDEGIDPARRRLLLGASALPLLAGAGAALTTAPRARASVQTSARIVIAGSGLGGLAVANRLARELDGAHITVVDRKEIHNYQPGFTLVGAGVWNVTKVIDSNARLMPSGVSWVREMVAEFDPAANAVVTDTGQRIEYDFLVVATGLHLDYEQIEGMNVSAIGSNGLASVYAGHEGAQASWQAMDRFREHGGKAIVTLPSTPIKCAGAPLKMTFMLLDRLKRAGTLEQSSIAFHSAFDVVFGVPVINDMVLERWAQSEVDVHYRSDLRAVDIGSRRATFVDDQGQNHEQEYDFLHIAPPQRAPDSVRDSDLAWQAGVLASGGWLEVDAQTLQHRRYPNVFGLGDINGTPRGKTAATIKKSAPMVAQNLIDVIQGDPPSQHFDGYTSCPLLISEGSAMLIEFDYEGRLTPTVSFVDPLQESYFAWLMKYRLLKPAYLAVARGRA